MPHWWTSKAEPVDVGFHRIGVNVSLLHSLNQHRSIVYPLGAGEDLLSSQEDVERV